MFLSLVIPLSLRGIDLRTTVHELGTPDLFTITSALALIIQSYGL